MQRQISNLKASIGFDRETGKSVVPDQETIQFVNLQLAALGRPIFGSMDDDPLLKMGRSMVAHFKAKDQLRHPLRPPVDQRIEQWVNGFLADVRGEDAVELPGETFTLAHHGLARTLSLPPDGDEYHSGIIDSYRVAQGVLHNPRNDRRTTQGVFHVCAGGLPVPADKKEVPKQAFLGLLKRALQPPEANLELPFTARQADKARSWVSLLMRPVICPEVPGFIAEKSMEVRFFAPGSLVSNLDFVESIFGNAGDPYLRENDSAFDIEHWSGHTGCVILAPHLTGVTKKELGLPPVSEATERQKADGMCWEKEDELYNDGGAFKITARDEAGVIVTLISDNYFGYCKKEVKTQISYACNLFGLSEEEHAGGALAFPSYDLGEDFRLSEYVPEVDHSFDEMIRRYGHRMELLPEGYAVDLEYPDIHYVPEDARFTLHDQTIRWQKGGHEQTLKLLANHVYILPSGYRVQLSKPGEGRRWRLTGTSAQATMCHKPCTVSGGGKSEISKSIADAIIHLPFYVRDLEADFKLVDEILGREYGMRFKDPEKNREPGRPILSPDRSLGSVIKLLTPREKYTDEHNAFIRAIPNEVKELVLLIKRFYKQDWGDNWRERFTVDVINGKPGHELKYRDIKLIAGYLRLGFEKNGSWRVFGLRKDFSPALKIQMEDDITASVVVPREQITGLHDKIRNPSLKFTYNCEYRLFQRPDDAIIRGYDKKTEYDLAQPGSFLSNYEPLGHGKGREMVDDAVRFEYFTPPMRELIEDFVIRPDAHPDYYVSSANPRLVDGAPSKNPRYLQNRLGLEQPQDVYIAEIGARLYRRLNEEEPLPFPVNAVLPGRRNNPPDGPIRNLAVFNPIHYLPLPEAFMEFVSSMTGKSPSTTGAGSEGALTKSPFNALLPITDLNAALVSYVVTGYEPFITAAGYVGPDFRVDHDISLLVPEIWCRMRLHERSPQWMIENGFLEPVGDVEWEGRSIPASILGYRITKAFVSNFFARVFSNPDALFTEAMLRPEQQGMSVFVDGIENMMTTHRRVAGNYFDDGSIELACPPLQALLHIMRDGEWNGLTLKDAEFRKLFDRETILQSDWYRARLDAAQAVSIENWERHSRNLADQSAGDDLEEKRALAAAELQRVSSAAYRESLVGTIGRDPHLRPRSTG